MLHSTDTIMLFYEELAAKQNIAMAFPLDRPEKITRIFLTLGIREGKRQPQPYMVHCIPPALTQTPTYSKKCVIPVIRRQEEWTPE